MFQNSDEDLIAFSAIIESKWGKKFGSICMAIILLKLNARKENGLGGGVFRSYFDSENFRY